MKGCPCCGDSVFEQLWGAIVRCSGCGKIYSLAMSYVTPRIAAMILAVVIGGGCSQQDPRLPPHYEIVTDGKQFSYTKRLFPLLPVPRSQSWCEWDTCDEAVAGAWDMYRMTTESKPPWRSVTCD